MSPTIIVSSSENGNPQRPINYEVVRDYAGKHNYGCVTSIDSDRGRLDLALELLKYHETVVCLDSHFLILHPVFKIESVLLEDREHHPLLLSNINEEASLRSFIARKGAEEILRTLLFLDGPFDYTLRTLKKNFLPVKQLLGMIAEEVMSNPRSEKLGAFGHHLFV